MTTLVRASALALVAAAAAAQAGVKVSMEVKSGTGTSVMTMSFEGKNVRMEFIKTGATAPEHVLIRDGEHQKTVMIDVAEKSYLELTDAEREQMKQQMEGMRANAMAQMKQQMAAMTPEQRAQMESMMGGKGMPGMGAPPPPAEEKLVKATGSKKVAGYTCELYKVMSDGAQAADACLITWADLKLDKEQVRKGLQALRAGTSMGAPGDERRWEDEKGMVGWRRSDRGGQVTESTLISFAKTDVPASAFEVPAGLTKKQMPGPRSAH